eukprot:CAMPEP_0175505946 /NCGR_PEP_ID=MMETSP0096-20121207/9103_1 /TAXON_ID=311494 /ORGANISM="Alexandrium monilatum, Strain CCMP3105" /LENGTH=67 /DNA_ID=CAMNT_0016808043 /DNA_START=1 /DNA_END=202 /DNA_ORIENTATION=-
MEHSPSKAYNKGGAAEKDAEEASVEEGGSAPWPACAVWGRVAAQCVQAGGSVDAGARVGGDPRCQAL